MSDADEQSAGEELWQQARENYEDPAQNLNAIAESLGVSRFTLVQEARKRGWKLRSAKKNTGTRATIQRFKELLQKRLAQLEGQLGVVGEEVSAADSEREIRATNVLVRTLQKVLELERKDRAHRARKIKERQKFDDAERDELAARIEKIQDDCMAEADKSATADAGSAGVATGMALLGAAQSANST